MTIVAGPLVAACYAYWKSALLFCFGDAREKLPVGLPRCFHYNIYIVRFVLIFL